jgi:hypothetical protein
VESSHASESGKRRRSWQALGPWRNAIFYFYIFFFDFSKIHVSSQILQNYTITAMWYDGWAQTP